LRGKIKEKRTVDKMNTKEWQELKQDAVMNAWKSLAYLVNMLDYSDDEKNLSYDLEKIMDRIKNLRTME